MTKIVIFKKDGLITGFEANGHAGFKQKGEDIVCAAISMLTINTINSLTDINHEEVLVDSEDGLLRAQLNSNKHNSSQVLLKSMVLGLESIQKEYGSKYCKVVYKEENANVKA